MTASGHETGSGIHEWAGDRVRYPRVGTRPGPVSTSENDHCGTGDSQKNVSAPDETASGHSESASEPDGPGSGPKTETGISETACGQLESVKGPGERSCIRETTNSPWSGSATRETGHATQQTASRHDDSHPGSPHHVTGRPGKSESGSSPQPRESATEDHAQPKQRSRTREEHR